MFEGTRTSGLPMTKSLNGSLLFWRNFLCIQPSNCRKIYDEAT